MTTQRSKSLSGYTIVFGLLCGVLVAFAAWLFTTESGPPDYGKLTLEDAEGRHVHLSDFGGRPVMLHFFTTWCEQCEAMAPVLSTTSETMAKDVQIIGVSLDLTPDFQLDHAKFEPASRLEDVKQFVKRHDAGYPILFDPKGRITAALNGHEVPVHVIFDSKLKVLRRFTGKRNEDGLRSILQACVEEDRKKL